MIKFLSILVISVLLNSFCFTIYSHCKMNSHYNMIENSGDQSINESCCNTDNHSSENYSTSDTHCPLDQVGTSQCECCIKQSADKKSYLIISSGNQNLKESISAFESENLNFTNINKISGHYFNYNTPLPEKDITILNENFRI